MIKNNMVFEIRFELVFVVLKKDSVQYLFLNRPDKIKINEAKYDASLGQSVKVMHQKALLIRYKLMRYYHWVRWQP